MAETIDSLDDLLSPMDVAISVGSSMEEQARVLVAQFGSNYAQRSGDGVNTITGNYSIAMENLTRAEAATVIAFFKSQGGYKGFYFTPPGEEAARLWRCEKWNRSHVDPTSDTVTAQLMEVFSP